MIKILIALLCFNLIQSKLIGLYDDQIDNIEILDANNFDQIIYSHGSNQSQQKIIKASFVEFYAHWCGGCKRYARHWRELAKETKLWHQNVIRVAAINCGDYRNEKLCRQHNIQYYPSLKLFPAYAQFDRNDHDGLLVKENTDKLDHLIEKMILFIENSINKPPQWPNLEQFKSNRLNSLFSDKNENTPFALLVFESDNSMIGRKLILDFSSYNHSILIRRINPASNPTLTNKFGIDSNFLPVLYLVKNTESTVMEYEQFDQNLLNNYHQKYLKLLNKNISINKEEIKHENNHIRLRKMIFKFIEYSNLINKDEHFSMTQDQTQTSHIPIQKHVEKYHKNRVFLQDLETALHLMLRSDIAKKSFINGTELAALKDWIRILTKV